MKKFIPFLLLAFAGCKDEATFTLSSTDVSFPYNETYTLSTIGESNCDWYSSDTFVVKVVNGVITPEHAGTAVVTARKGDVIANCKVAVIPLIRPDIKPVLFYDMIYTVFKSHELRTATGSVIDKTYTVYSFTEGDVTYSYYFDPVVTKGMQMAKVSFAGDFDVTGFLSERFATKDGLWYYNGWMMYAVAKKVNGVNIIYYSKKNDVIKKFM